MRLTGGEVPLRILIILSTFAILVLLGFLSFRLWVDIRLSRVVKRSEHSPIFKNKAIHIHQEERKKHIGVLMVASIVINIDIFLCLYYFTDIQKNLTKADLEISKQAATVKLNQSVLCTFESVVQTKNDKIENIIEKKGNNQEKKEIETIISTKISKYFNASHMVVAFNEDTDSVVINFVDKTNQSRINGSLTSRVKKLVTELEEFSELKQIKIQFTLLLDKENKIIYKAHFNRKKFDNSFKKSNEFEHSVKIGGGKG